MSAGSSTVAAGAAAGAHPAEPAQPPLLHRAAGRRHRGAWVLAGLTGVLYTVIAVLQWRQLKAPSWDLGIFTQIAKAYANVEAPIVPIKGEGFNILGDHFHPILVLLGPVFRLFPSGLTLLVVQALLVAVSVFPITRVAIDRLGRWPGVAAGTAYAISFGIQGAVAVQFHEIAFALPLLAFSLEAFLRGRHLAAAVWAAPLVFVKEDLGLTVAVLGLVLLWRGAGRVGGALAAWGLAWFVLATQVILPVLNPRGQWDYTDRLTLGDAVGDPLGTLAGILSPGEKIVTVLMVAAVAGVIGLRSPLMLAAVPTLAWRLLGDVQFYWGWTWHYNAVLMPIAIAALLDALGPRPAEGGAAGRPGTGATPARAPASAPEPPADGSVTRETATGIPAEHAPGAEEPDGPGATAGAGPTADAKEPPGPATGAVRPATSHRTRTRLAIGVSLAVSLIAAPDLALGDVVDPAAYRLPPRYEAAMGALETIPEGAVVASDIALLARLAPTTTVYWSGNPDNPLPEYVVIDRLNGTWGGNAPEDIAAYAEGKHPGADFEVVYSEADYQVARLVTAP